MSAPSVTLPYRFDTTQIWRMILTAMLALEAVIVVGLLYALLTSRPLDVAVSLVVTGAIVLFFLRKFLRLRHGSIGVITADRVVVRRGTLFGMTLRGPSGEFGIDRFSAVRVEMMLGPSGLHDTMQGGPHERIWLVGRDGTPNVLVGRAQFEAGRTVGAELGAALGLPVQETHEPY